MSPNRRPMSIRHMFADLQLSLGGMQLATLEPLERAVGTPPSRNLRPPMPDAATVVLNVTGKRPISKRPSKLYRHPFGVPSIITRFCLYTKWSDWKITRPLRLAETYEKATGLPTEKIHLVDRSYYLETNANRITMTPLPRDLTYPLTFSRKPATNLLIHSSKPAPNPPSKQTTQHPPYRMELVKIATSVTPIRIPTGQPH